jgi:hypothetical protein
MFPKKVDYRVFVAVSFFLALLSLWGLDSSSPVFVREMTPLLYAGMVFVLLFIFCFLWGLFWFLSVLIYEWVLYGIDGRPELSKD